MVVLMDKMVKMVAYMNNTNIEKMEKKAFL